ncbi:response regulator [Glycomyces harbinensis]|uniref:Transcriptional regulatory protein n=1 Tax=Glycomyces harbinensis TaxID=58114 RepID=A0A1G6VZ10_9ACTN|nr:response regulator [Glycomyces harbinensis]SDD58056.1 Response regulator of citrate/malate metabolism [Glycomyces harbinensis]
MIDVLVVDDDFRLVNIHRGFVERTRGFQAVACARTGEETLAAVREHRPDLVLLDLYLPDVFGLDLLRRMRSEGHDCDVFVISAAREAEAVRAAVRLGVVSYLLKPFSFDDFSERLEQYANRRAGLAEAAVHDQSDVDRAFERPSAAAVSMLPKGFSNETAKLVETALREAEGTLSAAECAMRIGISRVSARRYLEQLAERGSAAVALKYAGRGRPERRYRWRRPD